LRTLALPLAALLLAGTAFAQQAEPQPDPEATRDKPELRGFSIVKKPGANQGQPAPALAAPQAGAAPAPSPPRLTRPDFEPGGSVRVPQFELPPSPFLSPQALAAQKARSRNPAVPPSFDAPIAPARAEIETRLAPLVARMRAVYPVAIEQQIMGGVSTRIVTPLGKATDRRRVLINLHGGSFSLCADACGLLESIPLAGLGAMKVVAVNYRMAPEARHPAALEDVTAVYRELLKSYKPRQIGIFGCSAGGALTAQTGAWLPSKGLPQAGALGVFGGGGVPFMMGDSAWTAANIDGYFPEPDRMRGDFARGYFTGADQADAVISPALHPAVMAKFPPTMLITGTRAFDLSPAVVTNSALLKAGVRSTLIVGEGMGHCYIMYPDLPEARDAHQAMVNFFRENLK